MKNSDSPERSCAVCRSKKPKDSLFRIVEKDGQFIYDREQKIQSRGSYVCRTHECVKRLLKHKKYKMEISELTKMVDDLKKNSKDYMGILNAMKNSQFLTFGINMVFEDIDKIHFLIIAEDISEKNDKKIVSKAKEQGIAYVHYGDKNQLGEIFGKAEINVIGVKNKKVARGLME
ncbi:DUF448 domain-containing protein [uncultured Ilyobacter sp.]|uniref:DUF448 domain-containing protein n=1 Tax=uncultured Ilyobacter sp. TaxID=544433 RepID=UPI0029C73DD1|nr:DUF448 domain-containing protein [uncultured Ilyobacter sp.]